MPACDRCAFLVVSAALGWVNQIGPQLQVLVYLVEVAYPGVTGGDLSEDGVTNSLSKLFLQVCSNLGLSIGLGVWDMVNFNSPGFC
jgi:hypothetical protein